MRHVNTRPSRKDPERRVHVCLLTDDDLYLIRMMATDMLHLLPKVIPEIASTRQRLETMVALSELAIDPPKKARLTDRKR